MRELNKKDFGNGLPGQAFIKTPASNIRRHKLNKRKFFSTFVFFAALVALVVVGIQVLSAKDNLKNNPSAIPVYKSEDRPAAYGGELLAGKVVVVDAGHGGFDPGATGISGERESDLNLKMASVLQAELKSAGAKVIMTRTDKNAIAPTKDEDMAKRREITQKNNPDLFISIHMNMETDPSFRGPILMFQQGSEPGEELARAITDGINSNVQTLVPCKYRSADLIVLRGNKQPSVLVECGYISNNDEEKKLMDETYQKQFTNAICLGLEGYFQKGNIS